MSCSQALVHMEQTEGIAQAVEDVVLVVVAVSGIDHIDDNDSKTLLKLFMKAFAFHSLTQKVLVYCIIAYIRLSLQALQQFAITDKSYIYLSALCQHYHSSLAGIVSQSV